MRESRYNSFGAYMRRMAGAPVFKVNIDAGFTCPNRDGSLSTGGCHYCNNESFKPGQCRPTMSVTEQVQNGISYLRGRYGADRFLAYFQAYTNTYAGVNKLRALYEEALAEPSIMGLAIGTRPDCIDESKLDLLEKLSKKCFVLVEYGVQSVNNATLRAINRGHDYNAFLDAVRLTRERGIHAGAHMIVGFPTDTRQGELDGAHQISASGVGFIKIHQLQIVKDTPLAREFEREPFAVFGYDEYVEFAADYIERLAPDIVVQRLFATAPDDILVAPRWGHSRHRIHLDIMKTLERRGTWQGCHAHGAPIAARRQDKNTGGC